VRQFKLSTDPQFAAKLKEIVGLYVNPPDHAVVLSVDEKSQIQALDRTQPGLPMKKGRAGTMTHVLAELCRRMLACDLSLWRVAVSGLAAERRPGSSS
jgi:hypothetical protein